MIDVKVWGPVGEQRMASGRQPGSFRSGPAGPASFRPPPTVPRCQNGHPCKPRPAPDTHPCTCIVVTLQASSSPDATGPVVVPASDHPVWLQTLWHYDPDYAYDPETYEYGPYSTTDPCYIEDGVRLSPNSYHDEFLTASKANLLRFLELTGQDLPVTREVSVWNLPDLPLAR